MIDRPKSFRELIECIRLFGCYPRTPTVWDMILSRLGPNMGELAIACRKFGVTTQEATTALLVFEWAATKAQGGGCGKIADRERAFPTL
jgi:hypothetical protein